MIAPQLEFHDIPKVLLLGTNLWNSDHFFQMAGNDVAHAIFPVGFTAESQTNKVRQIVLSYKNEFERPPGYFEAAAYSAAMLMMNCLSNPEVRSATDLIKEMKSANYFDGITCPASFDVQGEPTKTLDLFRIKDREISLLQACGE